jgi:sortase A
MTVRIEPRKPSASRSRWILRWAAPILLFVFGISALGYCGYVMLDAHFSQTDQVRRFDQALLDAHASAASDLSANAPGDVNTPAPSPADVAGTSPLMPVFVEANNADPKIPSSSNQQANENLPLGRIEIASIGLTAMVEEGTGRKTLQRGVGHIVGTSLLGQSGNIGLAGHRDTFFRKLRNIHEGDEITVTTLAGIFLYRVDLISIVEPQDSAVLRDSGGDFLTLVTCYPFSFVGPAPKRFVVRARQVPPPPALTTAIN